MQGLINKPLKNLTVRDSGINYNKKIGGMFSSDNVRRMALEQAQGKQVTDSRKSVCVTRLIIDRKPGKLMPDLSLLVRKFSEFKREADAETKEYLSVGRNNYGNLLLELPAHPRNIAVAGEFLEWLDTEIKDVPVKKEFELLPVYLRKEKTTDSVLLDFVKKGWCELTKLHQDVVVYRDAACKEVFCRWSWHLTSKPTRRHKVIALNCYNWRVIWTE